MAVPELAPRRTFGGIIAVWVVAAVIGVLVGLLAGDAWRAQWLAVGLGGCLILAFVVQLWSGRSQDARGASSPSALGALVVLGVISLGFGLAAIVPG